MENEKNRENEFFIETNPDNLKYLSHQFDSFSVSNYSENSANDLKIFFGRMIHQLQKFESKIDQKLQIYVKNIKDQKNEPELVKFPILSMKPPISQSNVLEKFINNQPMKGQDFETSFLNSHSYPKPEKIKPVSQGQKRFDLSKRKIETSFLRFLSKKLYFSVYIVYHPIKILSKDMRNDPFCDLPPLSEKEAQRGLSDLINNGIIPKDLDLAPAFERNPPLTNYLIKIKEKPLVLKKKQPINQSLLTKDETLNLHLDTKTFITEKQVAIDDSLKSKRPLIRSISQKPLKSCEKRVISWKNVKLSIKKGRFCETEPSFQLFRKYNQGSWSFIQSLIKKLEVLLDENQIKFVDINAEKLLLLATFPGKVDKPQLVSCILNKEIIKNSMKLPARKFRGPKAEEQATICIQRFWRALQIKRDLKRKKQREKMVHRIQQCWKIYKLYMKTKKTIKVNFSEFMDDYGQILKKFKKEWPDIKGIERVELHLNSFSYSEDQRLTMENFLQRANTQISRIFSCKDNLIEIIYITPIELDEEIINYYSKVLQISELVAFKDRVHFLYPEGSKYLPYTFSTSKKLLFSPQALKTIKKIIGLKPAYIITGYPGENDLNIAKHLKIPCFCGNPITAANFSSKKGSRELFLQCNLPIPPSSSKFSNEEEFLNELVLLIYENQNISTWIFKINNEFVGRGIATFTLDTARLINGLKANKTLIGIPEEISEFHTIIKNLVGIKTVMACPFLYRNYREYLDELLKQGGVIEGTPPNVKPEQIISTSVALFIEPSGEFQVKATYEKLCGAEFRNIGYLMPNRNVNTFNLSSICDGIVKNLLKEDVFGYVTVDLLIFPDPLVKSSFPLFWLIGLDCFMNDFTSILYYFEFLVKGKSDPFNGRHYAEQISQIIDNNATNNILESREEDSKAKVIIEKFLIYCPAIIHPGLAEIEYKDFFHKCRTEAILFDLEKKSGASFLLIDALRHSFLSLVGIGDSWRGAVKNMTDTLNFLIQYVGSTNNQKFEKKRKDIRHDSIALSDTVNKIRNLNKVLEKEMEKNTIGGRKSVF